MTTKQRLSATVDAELLAVAQQAVAAGRVENVSAWVNAAMWRHAEHEARLAALDHFIKDYEATHGEITEDEMAHAEREMRQRAVVVRGRESKAKSATRSA
jgi:Arc/MetJ-type ribon-helix-helix transcriptional regulator